MSDGWMRNPDGTYRAEKIRRRVESLCLPDEQVDYVVGQPGLTLEVRDRETDFAFYLAVSEIDGMDCEQISEFLDARREMYSRAEDEADVAAAEGVADEVAETVARVRETYGEAMERLVDDGTTNDA